MIETQILSNIRWLARKARHPQTYRLRPTLFFFYNPEDIITDPKEIENAIRLDDDFTVIGLVSSDQEASNDTASKPT